MQAFLYPKEESMIMVLASCVKVQAVVSLPSRVVQVSNVPIQVRNL